MYENFVGHSRWLKVEARSGVPLTVVQSVVLALFEAASRARADGYLAGFDIEECALKIKVTPDQVAAVYRVLENIDFIKDSVILNWPRKNPRDKTSTDRQRNKRAKDDARRAVTVGSATAEQEELLEKRELEALRRLAALSRVTATPPPSPPPETIRPFVPVRAKEDSYQATEIARAENDRAARSWLLGDNSTPGLGYGPASRIVADNFGCTRLNAEMVIRRWLSDQMYGDVVTLATIISAAHEQALNGDGFRRVIEGRMAEYVREQTSGPTLPLGIAARSISGGRT
jgi:hypothetical protein